MVDKHTILYAEDDPDDLFMVQQAFEQHDHIKVLHAPNGADALQQLQGMAAGHHLPCLVILDINMPVMDGREALQRIKSTPGLSGLPIVLFSTSNSTSDKAFAANFGVELITKPLSFEDLKYIAETFVEKCNFEINKIKQM